MKFTFRDLIRRSDQEAGGYSRALQAARVRAAYQRSYFAPALFNLIPVATELIDSMAVDTRWRLYYNDVWVARHTVEENATLLIHEVGHLLRDHEARKKAAGITDHRRWTLVVGQGVPSVPATPAQPPANRPAPPVRDPRTPGYVTATNATELADGAVPPVTATGNFILGPTHTPAAEVSVQTGVPQGAVHTFTMNSADSKIYPGIARAEGTRPMVDPTDPARRIVTSGPAAYTRRVAVYVPQQYIPGTIAPFIVGADGPDQMLFTTLDNVIAQKRVPAMIAISIGNGSGDAQGSQRGLEYDTMSGRYAEFVESEVLPLVEMQYNVRLTKGPNARAAMGCSSGGAAALAMAWYHNDLYRRVLTYSGTYVNQQWPYHPETPGGAWEFHRSLIPGNPAKPIRIWLHVSDRDNFNDSDGMHDWVLANQRMAQVLASKGYSYQFVFARNAGHCDRGVKQQTLPQALEWIWKD